MGLGFMGLGFAGLGFRVYGFRVYGFRGFGFEGLGFRVRGFTGLWAWDCTARACRNSALWAHPKPIRVWHSLSSGYAVRHLSRAMPAACLFAACKALAVSVHLDLFIHVWDCLGVITCVSFCW